MLLASLNFLIIFIIFLALLQCVAAFFLIFGFCVGLFVHLLKVLSAVVLLLRRRFFLVLSVGIVGVLRLILLISLIIIIVFVLLPVLLPAAVGILRLLILFLILPVLFLIFVLRLILLLFLLLLFQIFQIKGRILMIGVCFQHFFVFGDRLSDFSAFGQRVSLIIKRRNVLSL